MIHIPGLTKEHIAQFNEELKSGGLSPGSDLYFRGQTEGMLISAGVCAGIPLVTFLIKMIAVKLGKHEPYLQ